MARSGSRQARINAGLCPRCGEEAAPYYLCDRCRRLKSLTSGLEQMEKAGRVKSGFDGRFKVWSAGPNIDDPTMPSNVRARPVWGEGRAGDKRLRPRIGRIPVDVERELAALIAAHGRPVTIEQINCAWGRMRLRKKRASAAKDLMTIIKADEKRASRLERNKRVAGKGGA